jgi:hypothetical protein
MGIPEQLLLKLVALDPHPVFVETGTFQGGTTFWAAKHFNKVVTIEVKPEFSRAVAEKPDCPKNIQFLVGSSAQLLPTVIPELAEPAVYWLDGHYCGPGTGGESAECPIIDELRALITAKRPIILIDDARCFLGPPPPPHDPTQWPSIDEIWRFLLREFPEHVTTIVDDVIISVPKDLKSVLDQEWIEQFATRFPQPPATSASRLRRAVKSIWIRLVGPR